MRHHHILWRLYFYISRLMLLRCYITYFLYICIYFHALIDAINGLITTFLFQYSIGFVIFYKTGTCIELKPFCLVYKGKSFRILKVCYHCTHPITLLSIVILSKSIVNHRKRTSQNIVF